MESSPLFASTSLTQAGLPARSRRSADLVYQLATVAAILMLLGSL